jgi:predicted enzyme related to lactoylglutathione lyase
MSSSEARSEAKAGAAPGVVRVWYATAYVRDFDRAVAFYRDTLGLPLKFADEKFGYASFATPGAGFSVARVDPADPAQRALVGRETGIAFGVDDLAATHKLWSGRGVPFPYPPTAQPWGGTLAKIADPEGNLITLDQYREERA